MHIVHVASAFFEPGQRGGGERYFNEYVAALQRPGNEEKLFFVPRLDSVHEIAFGTYERRQVTLREFHARMRDADLIHVHSLNTPGFDHALLEVIRNGPPIVLSDYGGGRITPGRALGRRRNKFISGFAAISNWSKKDVDPYNEIRHTAVIYGGGDHVLRSGGTWDPKYATDFLFVGRMLPHKGVHIAIEALPQDARLIVAGETRDDEYYTELKKLAAGKMVTFISSLDDEMLQTLYRSARFCVLPSVESYRSQKFTRPELLGLVVLEAMACGTPVIGSATGGLAEVLNLTGQYSARAGDVAHWNALMVQSLVEHQPTPSPLFTWESVARSTHELYARVAGRVQ